MRLALSSRLHVPVLKPTFSSDSYSLTKFQKIREAEKNGLKLDARGLRFFIQRPSNFKTLYFPKFDLSGKIILDIGAGNGECTFEYLKAGASKVICVEIDPKRYIYLQRNFGGDKRVEIETYPFIPQMLSMYPHDFCKINIGGYEIHLFDIPFDDLKPMHVLAHSQYHVDRLKTMGFKEIPNCGGQPYNGYAWLTNEQ